MTTTPRLVKSLTQVNTSDAPVNPDSDDSQLDGQVAPLADGGYVVVWTDGSGTHNFSGTAIVGQRYDSLGNKVAGEVKISQFSSGDQSSPAITALPDGNVAIAFVDSFQGDQDLLVRIFGPSGGASLNLVRTDFIATGPNQTFNPSLTAFADGSYVITYTIGTGPETDIVARIVNPFGGVGVQFDIDNQTDNRHFSEVATLPNGNFVVVYQDEFNGSETDTDIRYAVFSPAGTPVTGPNLVPGGQGLGLETDPDVAALREGGFVVVWADADSSVTDIRASLLNSVGTPLVTNILVNTTTTGPQNEASVVALADGGFLVTWEDDNADLVRAQRFDAAGNKIGTEFTVKSGVSLDSPEAALLADGGRIAYAVGDVSTNDFDVMTSVWRARDVSHDFDGDGKSGVLWRHDSGQVYFWEMNGLGIKTEGGVAHAPVPSDWHIQGAGDFDGDGNNDVLWRHDSGQVYFWEMDGLTIKAEGGVVHAPVPNDWHVQGTGDFDADGKSDILWRHDSGAVYFWEMDGLAIKAEGAAAHALVPNDWHIQGLGDFDGDGKSDLLWRHDSGAVYIWEMNGLGVKAEGGVVHAAVPNDWHIQGLGDFDGDGKSDILWRHDSGQVYIWEMNGLQVKAEGTVVHAPVGNDWHVEDIGDYNNDGKSGDILWRHDSGQVYTWEMNGLQITAEGGVAHAPVPGDWHIFSQHNFV
ncbi:MAG TPA: VCBS repeat-containing protein [Xanthobacteraceae bacterium]|nr:VCBS repeat-containing protein [Xanthobacteraceae bacterium]